jgi:hypothetical protein
MAHFGDVAASKKKFVGRYNFAPTLLLDLQKKLSIVALLANIDSEVIEQRVDYRLTAIKDQSVGSSLNVPFEFIGTERLWKGYRVTK